MGKFFGSDSFLTIYSRQPSSIDIHLIREPSNARFYARLADECLQFFILIAGETAFTWNISICHSSNESQWRYRKTWRKGRECCACGVPEHRNNNEVSFVMPIKYYALQRANLTLQLDSPITANRFSGCRCSSIIPCWYFPVEEITRGSKFPARAWSNPALSGWHTLSGSSPTEK